MQVQLHRPEKKPKLNRMQPKATRPMVVVAPFQSWLSSVWLHSMNISKPFKTSCNRSCYGIYKVIQYMYILTRYNYYYTKKWDKAQGKLVCLGRVYIPCGCTQTFWSCFAKVALHHVHKQSTMPLPPLTSLTSHVLPQKPCPRRGQW